MSSSVEGILYFGFPLPDTNEEAEEDLPVCMRGDDVDLEDAYNHAFGVGYQDWPEGWQTRQQDPEVLAFHEKHKQVVLDSAIEVGFAGNLMYDNCSIHYLFIKGYQYSAERYDMVEIPALLVLPSSEEIQKLKDFCEIVGFPYQEPKWYLTSYYG